MTIDELLNLGETFARTVLITRREKELMPIYHLIAPPGGQDAVIQCHWGNDIQKQLAFLEVKRTAHKMGAVAALFLSESWMVKRGSAADLDNMDPPSQQPDRIEVVAIIATDGTLTRQRMLTMTRDRPGGRLRSLDRQEEVEGIATSGRLIDGLIPLPVMH